MDDKRGGESGAGCVAAFARTARIHVWPGVWLNSRGPEVKCILVNSLFPPSHRPSLRRRAQKEARPTPWVCSRTFLIRLNAVWEHTLTLWGLSLLLLSIHHVTTSLDLLRSQEISLFLLKIGTQENIIHRANPTSAKKSKNKAFLKQSCQVVV